jgi:hypothetical protein
MGQGGAGAPGAKAQYKGFGDINDVSGYRFMLTAVDGSPPGGGGSDKLARKNLGCHHFSGSLTQQDRFA